MTIAGLIQGAGKIYEVPYIDVVIAEHPYMIARWLGGTMVFTGNIMWLIQHVDHCAQGNSGSSRAHAARTCLRTLRGKPEMRESQAWLDLENTRSARELFGIALAGSMTITLFFPSMDISRRSSSTDIALDKQIAAGRETGFNLDDPFMLGRNKPLKVLSLQGGSEDQYAVGWRPATCMCIKPGTRFRAGYCIRSFSGPTKRSWPKQGHIGEAKKRAGAVFALPKGTYQGKQLPYIDNLTATKGWTPADVMRGRQG